jgi:hypothetical protein
MIDYRFEQVIDYVDVVYDNPRDHTKVQFKVKDKHADVIKWCRKNFGARGDGWDFYGTRQEYTIEIWSSRLITMYRMWKE